MIRGIISMLFGNTFEFLGKGNLLNLQLNELQWVIIDGQKQNNDL